MNKSKVDTDVFNHFQELRFKIDEHRERLKAKIDDVALEWIEQTKKCETKTVGYGTVRYGTVRYGTDTVRTRYGHGRRINLKPLL